MNKLFAILIILILIFGGIWFFKNTSPPDRNTEVTYNENEGKWWDTSKLSDVKIDENWMLDPEIPVNYIPVIDQEETYMVLNDDGTINRYRKRVKNEMSAWIWMDIVEDDIPVSFKPVEGKDNIFSFDSEGTIELFKYIRNADSSYAYVPVDESGEIKDKSIPNGDFIPSNFVSVDGNNLYAAINEYGVIIEFWEKSVDDMGAITWNKVKREYQDPTSGVTSPYQNKVNNNNNNLKPQVTTAVNEKTPDGVELLPGQRYDIKTITENKTVGGWKTTYETVYTYIYNADGSLYSTHKDGPKEIARVQVFTQEHDLSADAGAIETTIDAELVRVSNGITYQDKVSAEVLAKLNSVRKSSGLNHLNSNEDSYVTKLARIFAADMAKYNYADVESPLYGTIEELANRYGIKKTLSINVWRCGEKSAEDIHTRLQTAGDSQRTRMSKSIAEAGIAITSGAGFYYIVEVFA